jgi:PAS domain-containing protein
MNQTDSTSSSAGSFAVPLAGRPGQQNHQRMHLGSGVDEQLRGLQMSQFAAATTNQQAMVAPGRAIMGNGNDAVMLDAPLMMSMDMAAGRSNLGSLDPQLSTIGDQFATMATASPLTGIPNDYGNISGGSTLTEFTKRRNWPQRILEELQDFLHVLTPMGKLVYASPSCKALTGFGVEELIGKFVTEFIHEDDSALYALPQCTECFTVMQTYTSQICP